MWSKHARITLSMSIWSDSCLLSFRNRAEFMCHMKPSEWKPSSSGPASGNWTLVDEGGEEVTCVCSVHFNQFWALVHAKHCSKHFLVNLDCPSDPMRWVMLRPSFTDRDNRCIKEGNLFQVMWSLNVKPLEHVPEPVAHPDVLCRCVQMAEAGTGKWSRMILCEMCIRFYFAQ